MPVTNIARVYGEHHPDLASRWNLASADAAITAHEQGDFRASARLVDAMSGRDDRVGGVLATRIQAVLGLPFDLQPPKGFDEDATAKAIVEDLAGPWGHLVNEDIAEEALNWRVMLGFWIGELIWFDDRGRLQDNPQKLKVWHPQHSRWDFDRGCFMLNTRDQGEVPVTHGDGKWIVGRSRAPRSWMKGAVRRLFLLWIGRQFDWRDYFLYGERTGQGILAAKVPQGVEAGERSQLVTRLASLYRGIIAELPQTGTDGPNADLDLLETDGGPETFEGILDKIDTAIAVTLLGQNLTTEVKGGSFAATKAHERVRLDVLQADTDGFSADLQTGIGRPWVERKYGDPALAPYPNFEAEPPEDTKGIAEGQKAAGDAVAAWQNAGYDVENVDEVAEAVRFKIKKRPEPKMPPALPARGAPPANNNGARRVAATQLARLDSDPGFVQGQEYVDSLVAQGTQRAQQALANEIAAIQTIIRSAQSPAELKAGLAALYAGADPTELATVLERARIMAELAGRYSVLEDVAAT